MKNLTKMVIAGFIGASVFAAGMVWAQGQGQQKGKRYGQNNVQSTTSDSSGSMNQQRRGQGQSKGQGKGQGRIANSSGTMGPGRLLRDEMRIVQIETIADLSGQSIAQVTEDAKTLRMPDLLTKYNLDMEAVEGVMHSKITLMVKNAADKGDITEEEALQMYTKMSTGPNGPGHKQQ